MRVLLCWCFSFCWWKHRSTTSTTVSTEQIGSSRLQMEPTGINVHLVHPILTRIPAISHLDNRFFFYPERFLSIPFICSPKSCNILVQYNSLYPYKSTNSFIRLSLHKNHEGYRSVFEGKLN